MSPKWSTWHAIHSCNCHWRLTVASHPAFISGPNFDPDVLFRPLRWWYSELNCNRHIATSVVSCASCAVMVYFPITITGMYCMPGRTLKRCKFYDVKGKIFSAILLLTLRNFLRFFLIQPSSSKQWYENCYIVCRILYKRWKLSRLTLIEKAVKNTTIVVIYKVLAYIQMSQPTTCFGVFYLGHLQVGYLCQRTVVTPSHPTKQCRNPDPPQDPH